MGILFSCWFNCLGKGDYTDTEGLIEESSQDDYSVDEANCKENNVSYNAKKINHKAEDRENDASYNAKKINQKAEDRENDASYNAKKISYKAEDRERKKDSFVTRESEAGSEGLDELDNKVGGAKTETGEFDRKLNKERNEIREANVKIAYANNQMEEVNAKDQINDNNNFANEFNTNSEIILDSTKIEDHESNLSLKTEVDLIDFYGEEEDYYTLDEEELNSEKQSTVENKNNFKNLLTPPNFNSGPQDNNNEDDQSEFDHNDDDHSEYDHNDDDHNEHGDDHYGDDLMGDSGISSLHIGDDHIEDGRTKEIESDRENNFLNEQNSLSTQIELVENNKNLPIKIDNQNLKVNFEFYENENKATTEIIDREQDLVISETHHENCPLSEVFISINTPEKGRNDNEDEEIESCQNILETRTNGKFLIIESEQYDSLSQSCSSISSTNSEKSRPSDQNSSMDEILLKEKKAYLVAKEIMSSEQVYVDVLRLVNITFREFVQNHQQKSVFSNLSDVDFNKIFSNLADILILNESLLNDFVERVKPESWSENKKISDVIVRKGPFLKIYSRYISKFSDINKHFENCCHKNPKFDKIVKDFEAMPICHNLKLQHFLLKPVQRLPQYKLLLQDYLKQQEPHGSDYQDTLSALNIVSNVADHANEQVKQEDKIKHLLQLQSRLGNIELLKAGRFLIKEGEVQKISRKDIITSIYLVLLNDFLLYTKYQNWSVYSSGLWVAHTIDVAQMEINPDLPGTDIFIKNNAKNFTFRPRTIKEKEDWIEAFTVAKEGYRKRSGSFSSKK